MMLTKILKSRLSRNNLGIHPVETCSLMVTVSLGKKEQTELECFLDSFQLNTNRAVFK